MARSLDILLQKLDQFIRRFYLNLLVKGAILFGAGFFVLFLTITLLEHFGYFGSTVRFFLFYGFVAFNLVVLALYVVRPLAGFLKIGKRISPESAARLIGSHFKDEVNDKITNALQLQTFLNEGHDNLDVVLAGIEQKASVTIHIPFVDAIDFRKSLRLIPVFIGPLVVVALLFFSNPSIIVEPATRIANYSVFYEKPAPFSFEIQSIPLIAFQGEDFLFEVLAKGQAVPSNASIRVGSSYFAMAYQGNGLFSYRFHNLQTTVEFFIDASGYVFGPFQLELVEKPSIDSFSVKISNPSYTKLGELEYENLGDLLVAEGASIVWDFRTRGEGSFCFELPDEKVETQTIEQNKYRVILQALESGNYDVKLFNSKIGVGDSLKYFLQVIKDSWPQIFVEQRQDSVLVSHLFLVGEIEDDYGFSNLEFKYRIRDQRSTNNENGGKLFSRAVDFNPNVVNQVFFFHLDLGSVGLEPGQSVEYFFVVHDNDGVNGPKATESRKFFHYLPTRQELVDQGRKSREEIKERIETSMSSSQTSQQEIEKLQREILESQNLKWQQRQAIENILEKQKELQQTFDQIGALEEENQLKHSQFNEENEHLQRQKDDFESVLEEIKDNDYDGLMEKIQDLLDKLDRDNVFEMINQLDFQLENFQNQMDRALEFYKRLEMEYLLQESLGILNQAEKNQKELIDDISEGLLDNHEAIGEQETINQDFEKAGELLDLFREKNEELRRPLKIDDTKPLENSIETQLDSALQELQKENSGQSLQNQKQGQQQMHQLAQRLMAMQESMFRNQQMEDARTLRAILENLLKISFSQEDLMLTLRGFNVNDPRYVELIQHQGKLQNDFTLVEDSLLALSKRQPQIDNIIAKELFQIDLNLGVALKSMIDRQPGPASARQQFVMTHLNNLALLLNEALQNIQMQLQSSGEGGMPDASGQMGQLSEMQNRVNQILQGLQQGHVPEPGQSGEGTSESEQLARAAMEQQAIRNRLANLLKELKDSGYDTNELQKLLQEMERTEVEIVNKNLNRQTINRQKRILSRLLEHEKALIEREMEERREGTTAKRYDLSNPELIFEYNRNRSHQQEMLRKLPPGFKNFYKTLVEKYLNEIF